MTLIFSQEYEYLEGEYRHRGIIASIDSIAHWQDGSFKSQIKYLFNGSDEALEYLVLITGQLTLVRLGESIPIVEHLEMFFRSYDLKSHQELTELVSKELSNYRLAISNPHSTDPDPDSTLYIFSVEKDSSRLSCSSITVSTSKEGETRYKSNIVENGVIHWTAGKLDEHFFPKVSDIENLMYNAEYDVSKTIYPMELQMLLKPKLVEKSKLDRMGVGNREKALAYVVFIQELELTFSEHAKMLNLVPYTLSPITYFEITKYGIEIVKN